MNFEQGVQYMPRAEVYSLRPLGIGSGAVKKVKMGTGGHSALSVRRSAPAGAQWRTFLLPA